MNDFLALLIAVTGCHVLAAILAAVLAAKGHLTVRLSRAPARTTITSTEKNR